MRFFDQLQEEHRLIERVAGALLTFAETAGAPQEDAASFVRFFTRFGAFHHEAEEEVLFPALTALGLPGGRGPVAVLAGDHAAMAEDLGAMERAASGPRWDADAFGQAARRYAVRLLHHIDAEDSVLFPDAALRLRRAAVFELARPAATAGLDAEAAAGEVLVSIYQPSDGGIVRGEGCAACPAYGERCEGLEREWWNEWEWEELHEHVAAG